MSPPPLPPVSAPAGAAPGAGFGFTGSPEEALQNTGWRGSPSADVAHPAAQLQLHAGHSGPTHVTAAGAPCAPHVALVQLAIPRPARWPAARVCERAV